MSISRKNPSPNVEDAVSALKAGRQVILPTETVYGLAANALDAVAVAGIFEIKRRPHFNPLIVHVRDRNAVDEIALEMPEPLRRLAKAFWPGPLTLVLPKRPEVPDIVTAGLPTVAVRVPDHALALEVLRKAQCPLAAPSANRFMGVSPTRFEDLDPEVMSRVAAALDGGPCRVGVESTIIGYFSGELKLLRHGGIPLESIESVIGPVALLDQENGNTPLAPGMLAKHYSPETPSLWDEDHSYLPHPSERTGLLCFKPPQDAHRFAIVEVLSETADLREAATKLFASLRKLDREKLDKIVARSFPEEGLGRAINDRLRRSAYAGSRQ